MSMIDTVRGDMVAAMKAKDKKKKRGIVWTSSGT